MGEYALLVIVDVDKDAVENIVEVLAVLGLLVEVDDVGGLL
jgi:hypothetical protein